MSLLNDIVKKYGVGESVGIKLKKEKPNHASIYTNTINEYGKIVLAENANLKSAINEILDKTLKR